MKSAMSVKYSVLFVVASFLLGNTFAIVRSSDAQPTLPVGMEVCTIRSGMNVLTNRFNALSPNQGCHLADFLKDADRGDILTFKCHDNSDGFVAVADIGMDGDLHWFDKRSGETIDGCLLCAYHNVFTWERKTDSVTKISFAGIISERAYPQVAASIKEGFKSENAQFTLLTLPFPSFAGKAFRIVLMDGRTKDVFFDKGTQLLYEVGKLRPLQISTTDIRECWELHGHSEQEFVKHSDDRATLATKDDLEILRRHIDQVNAKQTNEIKKEIRDRTEPEPITWWGCVKEFTLGAFSKLGSWPIAVFGLLLYFLLKEIVFIAIEKFKFICGYEKPRKKNSK